jgi:hypothetical protein
MKNHFGSLQKPGKSKSRQYRLLSDYFKDTFRKVERGNQDFCSTINSDNFNRLLAKSVGICTADLMHSHDQEQT